MIRRLVIDGGLLLLAVVLSAGVALTLCGCKFSAGDAASSGRTFDLTVGNPGPHPCAAKPEK